MLSDLNDLFFRFVTRGPAWGHVAVFLPLGVVTGWLVARWIERLLSFETGQPRRLSGGERTAVIVAAGGLYAALVLAVIQCRCQYLTEGGDINWAQWRLLYHFVLIALLIAATAVDLDSYLIPDEITLPGTLLGVGMATLPGNMQLMQIWVDWNNIEPFAGPYIPEWIKDHPHLHGAAWSLAGLACGAGLTWLARIVARVVLGVEALGFGDVTLMAMVGSFLGWQPVVFVFLIAPACGLFASLFLRLTKNRRAVPYGPYLSAAAVIVLFTWRWLWQSTREIFGHPPTLVGLAALLVGGMAGLLALLRVYRSIPVERRRP